MATSIKSSQDPFGSFEDPSTNQTHNVTRFTLQNISGITLQVIDYGATITSLKVPDKDGNIEDIVLGFDSISGYRSKGNRFFGATIGRVSNRIAKGKFTVDGKEYQLPINNGPNSLHGGATGFDKKMWEGKIIQGEDNTSKDPKIVCTLLSEDGDQGYPGDLLAQVTFQLTADNQLKISYQAMTTKTTPVALTNHSYFNLGGHKSPYKNLEGHFVQLNADHYTPLDENLTTKGEIAPVKGTIFDISGSMKNLKELLQKFPSSPFGYDNNFCINKSSTGGGEVRLAVRLQHKPSGRVLEVHSDQPGLQFYTGNFLPDVEADEPLMGKDGAKYWRHAGICLETQNWPNAVNHANFPKVLLQPGEIYQHTAIFKMFTVQ